MLGDVYGSEHADVHVIALLELAARGPAGDPAATFDPTETITKLKQFRKSIQGVKKQCLKEGKQSHFGQVVTYPETPEEFKRLHPEIYARAYPYAEENPAARPVASKVDETQLQRLSDTMPARVTHTRYTTKRSCPTAKFQGTCADVFWLLEPLETSTDREDGAGGVVMQRVKHIYGNYWDGGGGFVKLCVSSGYGWCGATGQETRLHIQMYMYIYIYIYACRHRESLYIYIYIYISRSL